MSNEDDVSTQIITRLTWISPVKRVEDLPTDNVPDGAMCFVETDGEEEIWQYLEGQWVRVDML